MGKGGGTEAGDRLGREALAYIDALHNLARYLTGSLPDAEDLVQETYTRALQAAEQFTPGTNLKAWLFRILRNTFVDQYRRHRNDPTVGGLDTVDPVAQGAAHEVWLRGDIDIDRLRNVVAEDIDKALKLGLNHPMGPFELVDLVGLDTRLHILEYLHKTLGEKFRPCPLLAQYVKAGRLGRKSGRGVFEYPESANSNSD